jgi:shikimate kinase
MKIFLVGFMGSGKTYWGRRWATKYDLPFLDLDQLIEQEENSTIADMFEQKGENYFRSTETHCLRNTAVEGSFIMACGGGAACFNNNMQWMNEQGITIFLPASPQTIFSRILPEKNIRPLIRKLTEDEMLSFIESKLAEREPFYRQAKIILPVDELNDESLFAVINY